MKCRKCRNEWNSSIEMEKCPFCGSSLSEEAPTEFADIPSVISYLVAKEGKDILLNPNIVISYIMDLVSKHEREKRLFRTGCSHGVLEKVHQILAEPKQNQREIMVLNLKQHLMEYAFMSEENAVESINMTLMGVNLPELGLSQPSVVNEKSVPLSLQLNSPVSDTPRQTSSIKELSIAKSQKSNIMFNTTRTKEGFQIIKPSISVGAWHTVGLKSDGRVIAIGHNKFYECETSNWRNVQIIAAGGWHTVGLKPDGTVITAGQNAYGERNVSTWEDIIAISASNWHTVGLRSDGRVLDVGKNEYAQSRLSDWREIVAISAGFHFTAGVRADGSVVVVGDNESNLDVSSWRNIVAVSGGMSHIVGLRSDGTVVAVGYNKDGRCDVSHWRNIVAVCAGDLHTIGLRSDGTVVAVGDNRFGKCNVSGWHNIVDISAGLAHTVGLRSDGTLITVGKNDYGQCNISDWNLLQ